MRDITVISDPGVDDMIALLLLDKLACKQRKLLISTFGNHKAEVTGKNAGAFAAYMQNSWLYRSGASLPYNGTVERPWPDYFHGPDGLWGVQPPRARKRAQYTKQATTDYVFSLGPLTETYNLLKSRNVKKLLIMGGTFAEPGNETDCTEFNVAMDPDAARLVFENCQGIEVSLVPMDATQKVTWSLEDIRTIPESNQTNRWAKQLLLAWFKNYKYASDKQFVLYDPLAVYLAFNPNAAQWVRSGVEVITSGKQRGRTVVSKANPLCNIAIDINDPQDVAKQIFSLLFEDKDNDS